MAISKEEAVKKLKKEGYNVLLEKGVVMFLYKESSEYEILLNKISGILDDISYNASWGIRYDQRNGLEPLMFTESSLSSTEEDIEEDKSSDQEDY